MSYEFIATRQLVSWLASREALVEKTQVSLAFVGLFVGKSSQFTWYFYDVTEK